MSDAQGEGATVEVKQEPQEVTGPVEGSAADQRLEHEAEEDKDDAMTDGSGDEDDDEDMLDEFEQPPPPSKHVFKRGASDEATLDELIAENERLRTVFKNLTERQTVLEEFIEVEHGEKFDSFLNNRERLVNVMGLGPSENGGVDGQRDANSVELVKLLKVVKSQAAKNAESSNQSSDQNNLQFISRGGGQRGGGGKRGGKGGGGGGRGKFRYWGGGGKRKK